MCRFVSGHVNLYVDVMYLNAWMNVCVKVCVWTFMVICRCYEFERMDESLCVCVYLDMYGYM